MRELFNGQRKFDAIVCFSAIDWDFLWQRTQEVMSQFAAMGYPVLFVENTGVRAPGIKDAPRVWNRLKNLLFSQKQKPLTEVNNNIKILSPIALPFPYSPIAVKWNTVCLRNNILQFSREKKIPLNRILLWSYMTTPLAVNLANSLPWAGVVVDLVSDPCKVSGAEAIIPSHRKMLELADVILCASVPIMNTAKQQRGEIEHLDLRLFEDGFSTRLIDLVNKESDKFEFPGDNTKGPLAAYIGGVNNKIWWDAVSSMALEHSEIFFAFVGPKESSELPCEGVGKNVTWYPSFKKYSQLGCFLEKCSVGLIPYVPNSYVAEMRPAKINEYLVMGLPIVATKLPELERLAAECGPGIIYLAEDPAGFASKLKLALDEDCEELRKKRQQIARQRSWDIICSELESFLQTSKNNS